MDEIHDWSQLGKTFLCLKCGLVESSPQPTWCPGDPDAQEADLGDPIGG